MEVENKGMNTAYGYLMYLEEYLKWSLNLLAIGPI